MTAAQAPLPWRSNIWEEDFSSFDAGSYFLGTNSRHDAANGNFILTPEEPAQAGRLYLLRRLPINTFDLSFRARFGVNTPANQSGADGIAFVMGAVYDYPSAGGGTLNFDGCVGFGMEFDTYENSGQNDPSQEHIALLRDRADNHLQYETLVPGTLEDGNWHTLQVRFHDGYIEGWIDGVRRLNTSILNFFPYDGYFGFTAATGSAFNEHRIDDISLSAPTRISMNAGTHNVCEPVIIDTSLLLLNNHPSNEVLTITDVSLDGDVDVFNLAPVSLPLNVGPGLTHELPLQIQLDREGLFSAILTCVSQRGERIYDTLRIRGTLPRLTFNPSSYAFATTATGSSRTATVSLRNTGAVAVDLEGLSLPTGMFSVLSPVSFPVHIAPGAQLQVQLQFLPSRSGTFTDTLHIVNSCGAFNTLLLLGEAEDDRIAFSFQPRTLLLQPGGNDEIYLHIDSLPRFTGIRQLELYISFPNAHTNLGGSGKVDGTLPPGSDTQQLAVEWGSPGFVHTRLTLPSVLDDTGAVFSLLFLGAMASPPCDSITLDSVRINDGMMLYPGTALLVQNGRICVNGSCRHPEGLVALPLPEMLVSPHPLASGSTVHITLPDQGMVRLRLRDLLGRSRANILHTTLPGGEHVATLPVDDLPAGCYMLELQWNEHTVLQPVLMP